MTPYDADRSGVRLLDRLEPAEASEPELPLLPPDSPSTCQRCGAAYDVGRFLALPLPNDGRATWEVDGATLAIRRCVGANCENVLGRRIK